MARKPASSTPRFLKPLSGKGKSKMVSCRIDEALYNSFQNAVQAAGREDWGLSLTSVMEQAMQDAIDEVNAFVGQPELDLSTEEQDSTTADQPAPKRSRKRTKKQDVEQAETTETN